MSAITPAWFERESDEIIRASRKADTDRANMATAGDMGRELFTAAREAIELGDEMHASHGEPEDVAAFGRAIDALRSVLAAGHTTPDAQ